MAERGKTKNIKIDLDFCERYLDKIKEILAEERELDIEDISYREATINLRQRLDKAGGLKEIKK